MQSLVAMPIAWLSSEDTLQELVLPSYHAGPGD